MAGPLLTVTDLEVAYGRVEAVRGVSLEVAKGEFVAVIGSNGAGKSSTMKAIAGVIKPRGGSIGLAGQDVTGEPAHAMARRGLAMVPEGRQVFADQIVEDNLLLGGYARSQESAARSTRLERAYQLFPRLGERRTQQAGSLSGGEQQMLAIARGLQSEPELLVIDELSLGLAPKILEMLAILLVEQLAGQALAISSRAYVLENCHVIASGASADLARDVRVMEAYLARRSTA